MQADTVSLQARGWGRVLAGLGPLADEAAEAARALLAGWDGDLAAGSARALLYACFLRCLAEALYRPVLGAATWAWMTSGALAPMVSMIRRWLGNDTWELLGGPVPPGTVPEADQRERRDRVLAAVPGALAAGVGRRGHGRRPRPRAVAVGRRAPRGAGCTRSARPFPGDADGRGRRHRPGLRPTGGGRAARSP